MILSKLKPKLKVILYHSRYCVHVKRCIVSSRDDNEVKKFGKFQDNWWKANSNAGAGPLHAMNPVRVGYIRKVLSSHYGLSSITTSRPLEGLSILDVGKKNFFEHTRTHTIYVLYNIRKF